MLSDLAANNGPVADQSRDEVQLVDALKQLLVVVENYPQLKAVESFRDFQAQYEGMENRIAVERRKFNEVVQTYNTYIRRFPNNMLSGMFGFEKKAYFASDEKAKDAPDIKF